MTASQLLTLTGSVNCELLKSQPQADRAGLAPANVRFWHFADINFDAEDVRFRGVKRTSLIRSLMSDNDLGGHLSLPGPCAPRTHSEPERAALRSCG